jgi:predicted DNA-binding transcriptional regulator AlpA
MRPLSRPEIEALMANASPWMQQLLNSGLLEPTDEWQSRRLVTIAECSYETSLSKSQWYRVVAEGRGPPPIRLSSKSSRWLYGEVAAFRDWLIEEGRKRPSLMVGKPRNPAPAAAE